MKVKFSWLSFLFESENITENKNGGVLLMDFSSAKIGDGML